MVLVVGMGLSGCVGKASKNHDSTSVHVDSVAQLMYARCFEVAYCADCKRVTVLDAWNENKTPLQRYYLYGSESDSILPQHGDGVSLHVPLKSVALGSCTQVEFVRELGAIELVKGMCNGRLVYNSDLSKGVESGAVADLGDSFSLDVEKALSLGIDAFFASAYGKTDTRHELLFKSGVPVIYDNEWMETDLLGRAEWIRFMACFFDREKEADSLFSATVQRYRALKQLAANDSRKDITILSGENFRGTWYLPGGRSYVAQLFRDAGADYLYDNDTTTGSIGYSVEQVLRDFHSANVWVGVSADDLQDLLAKDIHYGSFQAWKNGEVYAYDLRSTPSGANDYWESAVAHPDSLLSDFVKLCHPEMMVGIDWNFLRKLSSCDVR